MCRRGGVIGIVLLALGGVLVAPGPAAAITDGWRGRMLAKVNEVRAQAGVGPVRPCAALKRSAQEYAELMADAGSFSHTGPDGSVLGQRLAAVGYRAEAYGENIGAGQQNVVEVTRGWRGSPTHYATMTHPRFRHVGFGYATVADGSRSVWVQHFGAGGRC